MTFEPGACTAWHTHPLGQTLIVTFGRGWMQFAGGPVEEIAPGDIVTFAPRREAPAWRHRDNAMSHIAILESLEGKAVNWLQPVRGDDEYGPG